MITNRFLLKLTFVLTFSASLLPATTVVAGGASCSSDADCTDPSKPICNVDTNMCEAPAMLCFTDTDCLDPSFPVCDTDSGACIAQPTSSITGTVLDRADGTTPVHPVEINLLDSITGTPLGISTTNDSSGAYSFTALAPGDYKVLFNATGQASVYLDELYDMVPCDNGGCNAANLGDAFTATAGANLLNYELAVGYSLSGVVLNDQAQNLQEVILDIFDADGVFIGFAQTNGLGEWSKDKIPNGEYYVRTRPSSIPGYIPEIFDDKPCNQCDVLATGDIIMVNNANEENINFVLDPYPELIFESGFED